MNRKEIQELRELAELCGNFGFVGGGKQIPDWYLQCSDALRACADEKERAEAGVETYAPVVNGASYCGMHKHPQGTWVKLADVKASSPAWWLVERGAKRFFTQSKADADYAQETGANITPLYTQSAALALQGDRDAERWRHLRDGDCDMGDHHLVLARMYTGNNGEPELRCEVADYDEAIDAARAADLSRAIGDEK